MGTLGTAGARVDAMVRLSVALGAGSARDAQNLLDALRFLAVGTRLESGCLTCSAWTDPDWVVRYVEEWSSEPDLRRRVRSDQFTSVLAVVESAKDAHVQFDFVTTTLGLDYVVQVRGEASS